MEEQADLRRQLKLLESKNTALMQSNIGKDNFYFENSDLIISNISRKFPLPCVCKDMLFYGSRPALWT